MPSADHTAELHITTMADRSPKTHAHRFFTQFSAADLTDKIRNRSTLPPTCDRLLPADILAPDRQKSRITAVPGRIQPIPRRD